MSIAENVAQIRRRMNEAAIAAGRDPASIALCAATKMNDADAVRQDQIRSVHRSHRLGIFPADLHDLGVGRHHIVRPRGAEQLHAPLHSLVHRHIIETNA